MGIERIDKSDLPEYWQVAASTETHKDKEQGQGESSSDHFESLGERTDWKVLLDKSKLWKRNIKVSKEEIQQTIFRKINLKTDPSLLRVDIELVGGEVISPAFVSISRLDAFKIKALRNGDVIPENFLLRDGILNITIPTDPNLFAKESKELPGSNQQIPGAKLPDQPAENFALEPTVKSKEYKTSWMDIFTQPVSPEMIISYGVAAITIFFLILGIILLYKS